MKEITVRIPTLQFEFFMELLEKLQFAQVEKVTDEPFTPAQQAFEAELREALEQAELHKQGKIKLKDARTFLLEMKKEKEQNLLKV
jgi:hypothetical protein